MNWKLSLSLAFLASGYLLSRSICRSQHLLQRFALAVFVVLGVMYATFAMTAELKIAAISDKDFSSPIVLMDAVDEAVAWFPLDSNVRRTPAIVASSLVNSLPLDRVLSEIDMVAKKDPYAPDFKKQIEQLLVIMDSRK